MNGQEGIAGNAPPSSTPGPSPTPPPQGVQRLMPVLYVNKPASTATSVSNSVVPTPSPTIITAMPQIQLAGGGNTQIIHSPSNPGTYQYVPVRQVYQQGSVKNLKDNSAPKKVFVTSLNSSANKSNQVNLIIPNSQTNNPVNKSPITSLILPNMGTVSNKGTITGMLVPNSSNSAIASTSKQTVTSLLLPANKYSNIAPNKKIPIPSIIIPQQNVTTKPNIIRQSSNTPGTKNVVGIFSPSPVSTSSPMTSLLLTQQASNINKQPPTSVGLIIPTSAGSHGLIVPQVSGQSILVPQSSATQSQELLVPQSSGSQAHSIIVPPSTGVQSQLTNLILTSSASSTTPVASLLISNNSSSTSTHGASLLVSQSGCTNQTTSILVPVSVGPNKSAALLQPLNKKGLANSNKSSSAQEAMQSVLVKTEGVTYPSIPPLQPITAKDNIQGGKTLFPKTPNSVLNVPESLIMTPIVDGEILKNKTLEISDEMTIERTPISTDDKGTSTPVLKFDEKLGRVEDMAGNKSEAGTLTAPPTLPLRADDNDGGVVLDGEVTVRRLGPKRKLEADVEVSRREKRLKMNSYEDDVNIEIVKPAPPKLPPPRYQKPEDLNPMEVLEWDHQGVGKLPGSNIKFRISEFGLDLVVDKDNKDESSPNTPASSRRNSDDTPKICNGTEVEKEKVAEETEQGEGETESADPEDGEKIYCCEGCGCYGLYTEFLMDTRFCSVGCKKIVLARNEIKKKNYEDKMRMRRKRRKIKILANRARQTASNSDNQVADEDKSENAEEEGDETSGTDLSKAWTNKMAELRKSRKSLEGSIKINMSDEDSRALSSRAVSPVSEASENVSRSASMLSEDEASSDRTAPSDLKEMNFLNSSGEFLWSNYLHKACNKAKAAPVKLFKDPFPYGKNSFKVGMKLEGIDPEHQAIISVLTVAQVKGHRIRLHFDGFPEVHDFWTNSDSSDIFPPGWCERNNHVLDPPRGYTAENFSWNTYLKQCRASPAPKSLFPKANTLLCPSQFRVGMKLEAVDRKNSSLICVASVTNIIDNRLLIHFDSWGDVYDYWADPTSPYIHPVGWCEEYGYDLTPPNNFKNPAAFNWETYLKETRSVAAPARAFKPRPPNAFKRGMRLEAIDRRSPSCLRPATVKEVKDYQIKLVFDFYPEEFGYWVDDDCPDIHPCGWGHKTGHPITVPPMIEVKSECGTEGCTGDGNIKGGFLVTHTSAAACPYSPQNLDREMPDRFCVNPDFYEVPEPISKNSKSTSTKQDAAEDSSCSESRIKTRNSTSSSRDTVIKEDLVEKKTDVEEKTEERVERRGRKRKMPEEEARKDQYDRLRKELIQAVFDSGFKSSPSDQETYHKHMAALGNKVNVTGGDPRTWNYKQVAAFVNTVIPSRAKLFLDQEIDGDTFLMMEQMDLTKVLGLKLGPALKIYNCIILLRQKVISS